MRGLDHLVRSAEGSLVKKIQFKETLARLNHKFQPFDIPDFKRMLDQQMEHEKKLPSESDM